MVISPQDIAPASSTPDSILYKDTYTVQTAYFFTNFMKMI